MRRGYAAPITRTSRAASTTSRVTDPSPLISRIRPTCDSSRCSSRKFPPRDPDQGRDPLGVGQQVLGQRHPRRTPARPAARGPPPRPSGRNSCTKPIREYSWAVPRQPSLQPRHPDQHHPDAAPVEDVPHLLQPGHLDPVRLVDQDQPGRVADPAAALGTPEDRPPRAPPPPPAAAGPRPRTSRRRRRYSARSSSSFRWAAAIRGSSSPRMPCRTSSRILPRKPAMSPSICPGELTTFAV